MPPDVRWRLRPTETMLKCYRGYAPELGAEPPKEKIRTVTEGHRPSAHQAAQPQCQQPTAGPQYQQMTQSLSPKQSPCLLDNDVHIWRVPLNQSSERTVRSLEVLSPDEVERAARFHFDKDRNQFVQARAALRFILSEYLDADPECSFASPRTLEFSYGLQGKPALANGHAESSLRFNLSRRDGLALIAVTRGREIGVDVELVRADLPFFQIADVSFSSTEVVTLRNLPESLRVKGFYNCWTRKEAYVKARGEGLSFPLKQFDVSLAPGDPAELLVVRNDLDETNRWTLQEVPVAENYIAALVVEGRELNVTCRDWNLPG